MSDKIKVTKPTDEVIDTIRIRMAVAALSAMRTDVGLYATIVNNKRKENKRKRFTREELGLLTAVKETETTLAEAFLKGLTHSERRKVIARLKAKIKEGSL